MQRGGEGAPEVGDTGLVPCGMRLLNGRVMHSDVLSTGPLLCQRRTEKRLALQKGESLVAKHDVCRQRRGQVLWGPWL